MKTHFGLFYLGAASIGSAFTYLTMGIFPQMVTLIVISGIAIGAGFFFKKYSK